MRVREKIAHVSRHDDTTGQNGVSFLGGCWFLRSNARKHDSVTVCTWEWKKIDKICQDAYPKLDVYKKVIKDLGIKAENACFMGDDLPDIGVLKQVGFAVAVSNGCEETKRVADYITKLPGGRWAVREVIELILKKQNKWKKVMEVFS